MKLWDVVHLGQMEDMFLYVANNFSSTYNKKYIILSNAGAQY